MPIQNGLTDETECDTQCVRSVCECAFRLHICISSVEPLLDGLKVIYDIQTSDETEWHCEMNFQPENQIIY